MKKNAALLLSFFLGSALWAYDDAFLELPYAVSPETDFRGEVEITHKLYELAPGSGANAHLKLTATAWKNLLATIHFSSLNREFALSFGGWLSLASVQAGARATFYSSEEPLAGQRYFSSFYSVFVQSPALFDRLVPLLNVGYDVYSQTLGFSGGLHVKLFDDLSLILEGTAGQDGRAFGYLAGLWLKTLGHQFALTFGNSSSLGMKGILTSAPKLDRFHVGFTLRRKFDFYGGE